MGKGMVGFGIFRRGGWGEVSMSFTEGWGEGVRKSEEGRRWRRGSRSRKEIEESGEGLGVLRGGSGGRGDGMMVAGGRDWSIS